MAPAERSLRVLNSSTTMARASIVASQMRGASANSRSVAISTSEVEHRLSCGDRIKNHTRCGLPAVVRISCTMAA